MPRSLRLAGAILAISTILAACSGAGGPAAGSSTVAAQPVGSNGTLLVGGSNSMTVYSFSKDVANSGLSACTAVDDCIATWPAVTVGAGTTPIAGSGVTGDLGTISRPDLSGALQVTYKGLPLYFYSGDHAPGDSNGIYPDWNAVTP